MRLYIWPHTIRIPRICGAGPISIYVAVTLGLFCDFWASKITVGKQGHYLPSLREDPEFSAPQPAYLEFFVYLQRSVDKSIIFLVYFLAVYVMTVDYSPTGVILVVHIKVPCIFWFVRFCENISSFISVCSNLSYCFFIFLFWITDLSSRMVVKIVSKN